MKIKSIWLRQIHKWVGLVIGLQFLMWAISGTAMALLDMEEVAGGAAAEVRQQPLPLSTAWPNVQQALASQPVSGLRLRSLPQGIVYQATTDGGVRLFTAADGRPVAIDRATAANVACVAHPDAAMVKAVVPLSKLTFAVRTHQLPIWRVDFNDARNSSYYVSGTTGELLERPTTRGVGGTSSGCSTLWTIQSGPASTTRSSSPSALQWCGLRSPAFGCSSAPCGATTLIG